VLKPGLQKNVRFVGDSEEEAKLMIQIDSKFTPDENQS